ncbi:MAG: DUF1080 domain-containing protein [Pirellulaceae bacterium]
MKTRLTFVFLLSFVMMTGLNHALAQEPESQAEISLFNGENLDGWNGDSRLWSVKDGVIHGETTEENKANGNTFLICEQVETGDFELTLKFRCNAANNSGIQYRSQHITDDSARNEWVVRGYQHEIRNEVDFPNVSSFIYDEGGKRGRMCQIGEKAVWNKDGKQVEDGSLINQDEFKQLFKLDDWNEVRIVANGSHLQHYLNGKLVVDCTDNA